MYIGKQTAPKNRSANAILMGKNKFFLRMFLFFAKRIIVIKFPATTKTNVSIKSLHNVTPSILEGEFFDESRSCLEPMVEAEVLFIAEVMARRKRRGNEENSRMMCTNRGYSQFCVSLKRSLTNYEYKSSTVIIFFLVSFHYRTIVL